MGESTSVSGRNWAITHKLMATASKATSPDTLPVVCFGSGEMLVVVVSGNSRVTTCTPFYTISGIFRWQNTKRCPKISSVWHALAHEHRVTRFVDSELNIGEQDPVCACARKRVSVGARTSSPSDSFSIFIFYVLSYLPKPLNYFRVRVRKAAPCSAPFGLQSLRQVILGTCIASCVSIVCCLIRRPVLLRCKIIKEK